MVCVSLVALVGVLAGMTPHAPEAREAEKRELRERPPARLAAAEFGWVDVVVDSGNVPLAAYQVEVSPAPGANVDGAGVRVSIVGVEGGSHAAFAAAPYYDPAAIQGQRVIIGAFSLAAELPAGATRVARVHYMAEPVGDRRDGEEMPRGAGLFRVKLQAASGADGVGAEFGVRLE
jgi:hypothetical protein